MEVDAKPKAVKRVVGPEHTHVPHWLWGEDQDNNGLGVGVDRRL